MSAENGIIKAEPKQAIVPIVNGAARPTDFEGLWRLATLFHQGGMLPHGVTTPQQVCIALMAGMEIGLTPTQAMQNVMVVNNRPTVWGDAAIGTVWASGKMEHHDEGIEGTGDNRAGFCTVKRAGDAKPYTWRFSIADAKTAKLWGKAGPWTTNPERMLRLRARAFALRDKFADVLKGLGIREEVEDYQPDPRGPVSVSSPDAPPVVNALTAKIDSLIDPVIDANGMSAEEKAQIVEKEKAEDRKGFTLSGEPVS